MYQFFKIRNLLKISGATKELEVTKIMDELLSIKLKMENNINRVYKGEEGENIREMIKSSKLDDNMQKILLIHDELEDIIQHLIHKL